MTIMTTTDVGDEDRKPRVGVMEVMLTEQVYRSQERDIRPGYDDVEKTLLSKEHIVTTWLREGKDPYNYVCEGSEALFVSDK